MYYWQPVLKLISIDEFETYVRRGTIDVVLDARPIAEFEDGHIPGAIHIAWEDWNEAAPADAPAELHQPGYWGKLAEPALADVAGRLSAMGISNHSQIVVYADGMRSKGREGRIAWMLLYFGARNVSILNGGWRAWTRSARVPVKRRVARELFVLQLDERRRAYQTDVERSRSEGQLIDTRGTREFDGLLYEYQPRLGHIPGAINVPYRSLLHASGTFIDKNEYLSLMALHGIEPQPVWYCEVGVRAAMMSLMHELYTGAVTQVYDASFMQWAFDKTLPVEVNLSLSI